MEAAGGRPLYMGLAMGTGPCIWGSWEGFPNFCHANVPFVYRVSAWVHACKNQGTHVFAGKKQRLQQLGQATKSLYGSQMDTVGPRVLADTTILADTRT